MTFFYALMCCLFLETAASAQGSASGESWLIAQARDNIAIRNFRAATEALEKVTRMNGSSGEAWKLLTQSYEGQGLTDKAVTSLEKYIELDPTNIEALFKLATYFSWKKYSYRRAESIVFFERALAKADSPHHRLLLARLLAKEQKTYKRSMVHYQVLIRTNPSDSSLRNEYSRILAWDKDSGRVYLNFLEESLSIDPSNDTARRSLVLSYLRDFDLERGLSVAEPLGSVVESDLDIKLALARAYAKKKRPSEAQSHFVGYLAKRDDPSIREEYANLLASMPGRSSDARREYQKVLLRQPNRLSSIQQIGSLQLQTKKSSVDAVQTFKNVLRLDPNSATAHVGLARAFSMNNESDLSIFHARKAVDLGSPETHQMNSLIETMSVGRETGFGVNLETSWSRFGELKSLELEGSLSGKTAVSAFSDASAAIGYRRFQFNPSGDSIGTIDTPMQNFELKIRPRQFVEVRGEYKLFSRLLQCHPHEYSVGLRIVAMNIEVDVGHFFAIPKTSKLSLMPDFCNESSEVECGGYRTSKNQIRLAIDKNNILVSGVVEAGQIVDVGSRVSRETSGTLMGVLDMSEFGDSKISWTTTLSAIRRSRLSSLTLDGSNSLPHSSHFTKNFSKSENILNLSASYSRSIGPSKLRLDFGPVIESVESFDDSNPRWAGGFRGNLVFDWKRDNSSSAELSIEARSIGERSKIFKLRAKKFWLF